MSLGILGEGRRDPAAGAAAAAKSARVAIDPRRGLDLRSARQMTSAADHARTDRGRGSARDARTTDAGGPRPRGDGAFDAASVMLDLQGAAGNRAVADLVAHAGPRAHPRTLPFSVQRQPPTRKGGGAPARRPAPRVAQPPSSAAASTPRPAAPPPS